MQWYHIILGLKKCYQLKKKPSAKKFSLIVSSATFSRYTWIENKPPLDNMVFTENFVGSLSDNLTMRRNQGKKQVREMKLPDQKAGKKV